MKEKTSIRYFNNKAIRFKWSNEFKCWCSVCVDLINSIIVTNNPRKYWNTFKNRHNELDKYIYKVKVTASDGKMYYYDCISNEGARLLVRMCPNKYYDNVIKWLNGESNSLDEASKKKAYELYDSGAIEEIEVGKFEGLCQIHSYIFDGLYPFSGKLRNSNISKDGFLFASYEMFGIILARIDEMKEDNFDNIIDKYIEMNACHPFMEGNGRATRIWLDLILKKNLKMVVDWSKIKKEDYLSAMRKSVVDESDIKKLINGALTDKINDRDLFFSGIDYSYYYEEIEY